MSRQPLAIITASAGTGKTYRLALEYIRILLDNYRKGTDFSLDNILVLTFTRKATAEIRERVEQHLALLVCVPRDDDQRKEKQALISSLWPQKEPPALDIEDEARLLSAQQEIAADRKKLQVMTIDAYIGAIFRNIVRPLRSIENFDIDEQAVEKRLPLLFEHLMGSELKPKLENLLRRKVSPSLDEYRKFFASMINNRWLYYQITEQGEPQSTETLSYQFLHAGPETQESLRKAFLAILREFVGFLAANFAAQKPEEMFNSELKKLTARFPEEYDAVLDWLERLCSTPQGCHRLYKVVAGQLKKNSNVYNGAKLTKKIHQELKARLNLLQTQLLSGLADHLVHALFLPEQREILDIWKAVLDRYDELIYKYKNLTYNDIAWYTLEALFKGENPQFQLTDKNIANEFYLFLSHRSRFILIDEFQDTSLLQFNILRPIIEEVTSGEGSRDFSGLVVVGDEKQSIFGWRGGERDLLLNLPQIIPALHGVKPEPLDRSYRSSASMLRFINSVFGFKPIHDHLRERGLNWEYKPCQSEVHHPDYPTKLEYSAVPYTIYNDKGQRLEEVMRDFVTHSLVPEIRSHPEQEMAVLCRKGRELELLQQLIEEAGQAGIFQPSSILPDHPWISPLLAWLRYLAFGDPLDFLEVLRFNYIMLKAAPLKKVVDLIARARELERDPDFSEVPVAAELQALALDSAGPLSEICQRFLDLHLRNVEPSERDFLNIHAFLSLLRNFELSRSERDKSIPAFLDYLDANRAQEFLKQVAVKGKKPLQLLTIHKAKGLQFDRVFVFYNLSGRKGFEGKNLSWYLREPSPDFKTYADYALTYHYDDILANSSYQNIVDWTEKRALLEELNTLYVAFTRAKTSLHVCMAYQGSGDYEAYRANRKPDQMKLPTLIADAARASLQEMGAEEDGQRRFVYAEPAYLVRGNKPSDAIPVPPASTKIAAFLPCQPQVPGSGLIPNPTGAKNWKKIWLEDRRNLIGDLIHHYLSFVKWDKSEEHERAGRECLARFGSLFTQSEIAEKLDALRRALPREKIFLPGYDKVFTEFTLYGGGSPLRLDRLMLDTKNKQALILDYKTGGQDQAQLDTYKKALESLPAIREGGYNVSTAFVDIRL